MRPLPNYVGIYCYYYYYYYYYYYCYYYYYYRFTALWILSGTTLVSRY